MRNSIPKTCPSCGEADTDKFGKDRSTKSGLDVYCKKCRSKKGSGYRNANIDKCREMTKNWHFKNQEKDNKGKREWYENNKNRKLAAVGEWKRSHPEKVKEYKRARRARENNCDGRITEKEWQELKEFYSYACLCCNRKEPEIKLDLDHVLPLKLGGLNKIENAQPLCRTCNLSKGAKHIDYRRSFK